MKAVHLDYACGPGMFIGNYTNCNSIGFDISHNQMITQMKNIKRVVLQPQKVIF